MHACLGAAAVVTTTSTALGSATAAAAATTTTTVRIAGVGAGYCVRAYGTKRSLSGIGMYVGMVRL